MENFGQYLKTLRQKRELTLGQVAQRSGISKATISRWETGVHSPRVTELTEVLGALQLTETERTHCLGLLEVPRALHLERRDSAELRLALGDILYALRQRIGMTQEELARRVGVSRSLCRKWELGDSRPSDDQLHSLGFALGVPVEEVALLTTRTLSDEPLECSREALLHRYNQMDFWALESNAESSLLLLTLLAGFKSLLRQGRADAGDIALILTSIATDARMRYGDREREHALFRQAHRMALRAIAPLHQRTARMLRCLLNGPTGTAVSPERNGIEKALQWRPRFAGKSSEAYLLSIVACSLSQHSPKRALQMGETYCALVADEPSEYHRRLRDRGNLLYHCGRPAESAILLASLAPKDTVREGLKHLELCRSLIALNARSEAAASLEQGKELLAGTEILQMHELISELEQELTRPAPVSAW